jgi:hypothetical protein
MIAIFQKTTIDFANQVADGFVGTIRTDVKLDPYPDDNDDISKWPINAAAPQKMVGESVREPGRYRVFKYERDMEQYGFRSTGKRIGILCDIYQPE